MTPVEQVQEKIARLDALLTQQLPGMPTVLQDIHKHLKKDESLVTLLSEQEIGVIVSGLSAQTKTTIVEGAVKKAKGKSLKSMTLADL